MFSEYRERRREEKSMGMIALLAILILAGGVQTLAILYHKVFSTEYEAGITNVSVMEDANKRPRKMIRFEFTDADGKEVSETQRVSMDARYVEGDQIRVRVRDDEKEPYKIVSANLPVTVYLFGIAAFVGGCWVFMVSREAA